MFHMEHSSFLQVLYLQSFVYTKDCKFPQVDSTIISREII